MSEDFQVNPEQAVSWDEVVRAGEESVAQIQERLEFEIPAGQDPLGDIEDLLVYGEAESEPETDVECSIERPSNLRPPSTEGTSPEFTAAVDAYVHEMCAARWPKLKDQHMVELNIMLETAAGDLAQQPTGNVVVLNIQDATDHRRSALMLNFLLALLHCGHAAVLEDDEMHAEFGDGKVFVTRIIIKR